MSAFDDLEKQDDIRSTTALISTCSLLYLKVKKLLPQSGKKSLISLYLILTAFVLLPTLVYLEFDILGGFTEVYEISEQTHLDHVQSINMDHLSEIILPRQAELFPSEDTLDMRSKKPVLFDPRLPVFNWLQKLKVHLLRNNGVLDPNFAIPFSWNDWVDLNSKLTLNGKHIAAFQNSSNTYESWSIDDFYQSMDCDLFAKLFNVDLNDNNFQLDCIAVDNEGKYSLYPNYPFNFKGIEKTGRKMDKFGRIIYGASYLYTTSPAPDRVHFIGAGYERSTVVIKTERDDESLDDHPIISKRDGNLLDFTKESIQLESKLTGKSIDKIYQDGLRIDSLVKDIRKLYSSKNKLLSEDEIKFDDSYLMKLDDDVDVMSAIELPKEKFIWNHNDMMNQLQSNIDDVSKIDRPIEQSMDYRIFNVIKDDLDFFHSNGDSHSKHLEEAKLQDTHVGDHYDWRFFNGHDHPEFYRQGIIHRIGRAWLRFCYQSGLTTFVAYGSMLGWIRNGLSLPWDEDIDVVVTLDSMYKLARNHNNSLIVDVSSEDKYGAGIGSYYLDIGPSFFYRRHGEGANAIDGRFIDTASGVYIDISAVAWTENYFDERSIDDDIKMIIDSTYRQFKKEHPDDIESKDEELARIASDLQEKKEIYHCRNNNAYSLEELTTMVPTYFEGVRTHVPHQFKKLLDRKYPGALDRLTEPGYTYHNDFRLWFKNSECTKQNQDEGHDKTCWTEENLELFHRTANYTAKHLSLLEDPLRNELPIEAETIPMKYDEFIIDYAHYLNAKLD